MTRVHLPIATDTLAMFPPLHARWVNELLDGAPLPRETNATCDACAMLPEPGTTPTSGHWFNPATRCCTYLPELANFLVGAILADTASAYPEGAASVRARIAAGRAVTPMGLLQHAEFHASYDGDVDSFGRDESLLCPHYVARDGGRCGIWEHRESTCSTWFCKHTRGAVNKGFWNRLHHMLREAERALARHCAVELGVAPEALAALLRIRGMNGNAVTLDVVTVQRNDAPGGYARMWGAWLGREEDFYRACAALVEPMSWGDVVAASGSEVRALASVVKFGHAFTQDDALPERVTTSPFEVVGMSSGHVKVQGYSFLDPLDVPRSLFDVMHHFDGRPVAECLRDASQAAGEPVPPGAIRMLIDFRILRAVEV